MLTPDLPSIEEIESRGSVSSKRTFDHSSFFELVRSIEAKRVKLESESLKRRTQYHAGDEARAIKLT